MSSKAILTPKPSKYVWFYVSDARFYILNVIPSFWTSLFYAIHIEVAELPKTSHVLEHNTGLIDN